MAKIKLTKNELKKQKDGLKRYQRYLPTLFLKKQQLQIEILKIHKVREGLKKEKAYIKAQVYEWADVFAEDVGIKKLVSPKKIVTTTGNIAGIDIPIFEKMLFDEEKYDLMKTPLWVDYGVETIKKVTGMNAQTAVLQKQEDLIREELRITTQRVNLFEKVMIPQAKENIRRIRIYLGDLETAAVVTGKIAKEKIQKKTREQAAV
jgi:V/A-type H+-transporting ATPase subunit D